MELFEIVLLSDEVYSALIIGNSCEAPTKLMCELANELINRHVKGRVLFDMLMHSGNSDERFLSVYFDGDKFVSGTFEFIKIEKNSKTRKLTANYFKQYPEIVEYSLLNSFQKKLILKGCGI